MRKILLLFFLLSLTVYSMAMENVPLEKVPKPYVDFARKAIQSINTGDGKFFDQAFDIDDFVKRVMTGYELPPKQAAGFKRGFKKGFSPSKILLRIKAHYTLLGFQKDKNDMYLVLRLLNSNGMVNYHKILLTMRNGKPSIVDTYTFTGGEFLTRTIGRATLQMVSLYTSKKTKTLKTVVAFFMASKKRNYNEILKLYELLPEKYQKDKSFLAIYYQAAFTKGIDSREFKNAIMNFEKYHSNTPSLDLMLLDPLFLGKKYDALLKRIDNIEKKLGYKDAHLECLRGNIALVRKQTDKAEKLFKKAIQIDNYHIASYWGLVNVYLEQKQWSKICNELDTMKKFFNIKFNDLAEIPTYVGFVKSKEYKAWLKKQKTPAK